MYKVTTSAGGQVKDMLANSIVYEAVLHGDNFVTALRSNSIVYKDAISNVFMYKAVT